MTVSQETEFNEYKKEERLRKRKTFKSARFRNEWGDAVRLVASVPEWTKDRYIVDEFSTFPEGKNIRFLRGADSLTREAARLFMKEMVKSWQKKGWSRIEPRPRSRRISEQLSLTSMERM